MKKGILVAILLVLAVIIVYKLFFSKTAAPPEVKDQSLVVATVSSSFDSSFAIVLNDYYAVKDALVQWDTAKANHAAFQLGRHADALPFQGLKADSSIVLTAKNFTSSIVGEAKGFVGEDSIEQKRRALNMLTDELYNLIRTTKYSGSIVYHIKCPMAFHDEEEGYWLSSSNHVANPYLGTMHPKYKNKMLGCGEVVDSLDFSKK